jgi:hypothetical protein
MDRVWYGYELEGWSGCGSDGGMWNNRARKRDG